MDYRLNPYYNDVERQIHEDLLKIIKEDGVTSVQQALKRLGKPSSLEALKTVLQSLYQFTEITATSVIAIAKKKWRKKRYINKY